MAKKENKKNKKILNKTGKKIKTQKKTKQSKAEKIKTTILTMPQVNNDQLESLRQKLQKKYH